MADFKKNTSLVEEAGRPAKNIMRRRSNDRREPSEFEERVIEVRRVARTVKGGRRIRFRALVIIGNRKGKVGMGLGKANDVSEAVKKAVTQAKKNIVIVPIINGSIPYEVISKHGSAVVLLKPAASGTSIVAGGSVRAVADLAGITDLLSKMLGSANKVNNIIATMKAFSSFNEGYTDRIRKAAESKENMAAAVVKETTSAPETPKEEVRKDVASKPKADKKADVEPSSDEPKAEAKKTEKPATKPKAKKAK